MKHQPKKARKVKTIQQGQQKEENIETFNKRLYPKTNGQEVLLDTLCTNQITICIGPAGSGKAQPLDSLVYTPNGPKYMGDIKINDIVLTPNGHTSKVVGVYPQGFKNIYKVWFNDNTYVESCKEHLWLINEGYGKDYKQHVVDTEYMITKFEQNQRCDFYIDVIKPCYFESQQTRIDPYILGLLLGDGCLVRGASYSTKDIELLDSLKLGLPNNDVIQSKSRAYDYTIIGKTRGENKLVDDLRYYKLIGTKSNNKFIPKQYIYNSIETRISILQGLMDTDGCLSNYKYHFSTVSKQLAFDVKEIAESLGGVVKITTKIPKFTYKGVKKNGQLSYNVYIKLENINLFRLKRKQELVKTYDKYHTKKIIKKIEFSRNTQAQCIMLDSKEHMYITDNFVQTHNTCMAVGYAIQHLMANQCEKIILCRPIIAGGGEDMGHLPGTAEEKIHPYLIPLLEELKKFASHSEITTLRNSKQIEIVPMSHMRGRNFHNAVVIIDESQNATLDQLKMVLTRHGQNSKTILIGDIEQSDLKNWQKGGLYLCYNKLKDEPDIGTVELTEADIVRNELVGRILRRLKEE